ncbi:MAG: DnaT-like ssDNA-binding domain-containing protein [Halieaceae bacterium]|jgi:hypothetical protein|nr:DnaT-like ssDNA-binding domain-containing protein [Halieaceae bacterium]
MSSGSLIPDRQLTFSPDLAQTIGLEEAILLQGIGHRLAQGGRWHTLQFNALAEEFPFWSAAQIQSLLQRLSELGILSLLPAEDSASLRVALAETHRAANMTEPSTAAPVAEPIAARPASWQPPQPLLELLQMNHGIDREFALAQLQSFQEGDLPTRESRYRQHVLGAWRQAQARHPVFEIPQPPRFDGDWQPSADAMDILRQGGVDAEFVASVRAEFILYWRERGGPPKDVNSRFVAFVRQRWARYQSGLTHTREPQRLQRDWQPDPSVWDLLDMAGVDRQFVREKLPEFVLYWVDSNELHTSWNSKFLQHIKHQWRRHQAGGANDQNAIGGGTGAVGRTRDRSLADDLSDSSWAN